MAHSNRLWKAKEFSLFLTTRPQAKKPSVHSSTHNLKIIDIDAVNKEEGEHKVGENLNTAKA